MHAFLPRVVILNVSIYLIVYLNLLSFQVAQKATIGLERACLYITI